MRKNVTSILIMLLIIAVAFCGVYAMGLLDGDGVSHVIDLEYPSGGFVYSGDMKDGLFSGRGTIKFDDGSSYSGGFEKGRFSGDGEYRDAGGNLIYSGSFINGAVNGQ